MKILSAIINLFCLASALWPYWPPPSSHNGKS